MIKYYLTCIFLCVLCSTNSFGQPASPIWSGYQTELLAIEKEYFMAISHSESSGSALDQTILLNDILVKKINCHKNYKQYQAANEVALRLDFINLPDSIQYIYRKELITSFYFADKFDDAYNQIIQHKYLSKETALNNYFDFWEILIYSKMGKYGKADSLLNIYAKNKSTLTSDYKGIEHSKKTEFKSVKKAKKLATFLPGAGMLYLGQPKEAIFSAGLQGLSLGWGVYNILNQFYASGLLTGLGLFQTFYFGGIKRTEILANEVNNERNNKVNEMYLKKLLEIDSK